MKVAKIELPLSQFRVLQTIKIGTGCTLTTTLLEIFHYCNPTIKVVANSELKDIGVDKKIVAKVYIEDNKEDLEFYMLMGIDIIEQHPVIEEIEI